MSEYYGDLDDFNSNDLDNNQYYTRWSYVEKSNSNKWIPREDLYIKYNNCSNVMADKNRNMSAINNLKIKIKNYKNQFEEFSKSTDEYKKSEALEIKLNICDFEMELLAQQNNIDNLKYTSPDFFSEWSQYLDDAKKFIIDNKLYNVVKVKDILSNNNLKIVKRRNIDGYNVSVNKSIYADNIKKLNNYFDILE
jgi:hypothetical protein